MSTDWDIARIEAVATVIAKADTITREGLTDAYMLMAQALDDAGLIVPDRVAGPLKRGRRRALLLATVRREGGEWSVTRAERLYKRLGHTIFRATVRTDLEDLCAAGFLELHGDAGHAYFTATADGAR